MKQAPVTSASGMFTRFNVTRVLKTSEVGHNQLLRAFDTLRENEIHRMQSLVIVDKIVKKNGGRMKQFNILRGVLVSDEYYEAQKLLSPTVVPYIKEFSIVDDFLLPEDRFARLLPRTNPMQERLSSTHVIGGGGLVSLGVAFEDATLEVSPGTNVPTLVDGAAGEVTFPLGDVGDQVTLAYVTQAVHPVFFVKRQASNPTISELRIKNETHAVLLNSTLAGLLGITLPAY